MARAWPSRSAWVSRATCRGRKRSATTPPTGARTNDGAWDANATMPSQAGCPVMRCTIQATATLCIHVPTHDTSCPEKYSA